MIDSASDAPRRVVRWLLVAGGAAVTALLFAQTWARAARPGGIDFTTYLAAARAVAAGDNPYTLATPFPYLYPAFLAWMLIPIAWLPHIAALTVWFAGSLCAAVWSIVSIAKLSSRMSTRRHAVHVAAVLAVAFPIVQSNLRNGQVNLFVLAAGVAALRGYLQGQHGMAGVAWAAAIATKLMPAMLAPFYLRRRAWTILLTATVGVALMLVLPALTGGADILGYQRDAAVSLLASTFGAPSGVEPLDFSVGGVLIATGLQLPPRLVRIVAALLVAATVIAIDLRSRTGRESDARMFSLYLAAIPLASPKSEVHHLAFAIPAMSMVVARLLKGRKPQPTRQPVLSATAAACYGLAFVWQPAMGMLLCAALVLLGAAVVPDAPDPPDLPDR